jgi:hypothetical protein
MRGAHRSFYGFEPNDKFINDLAAYVKSPTGTPSILSSGDAQTVREAIQEIYGFWVTAEYANDLLAFAEKQPKGNE